MYELLLYAYASRYTIDDAFCVCRGVDARGCVFLVVACVYA